MLAVSVIRRDCALVVETPVETAVLLIPERVIHVLDAVFRGWAEIRFSTLAAAWRKPFIHSAGCTIPEYMPNIRVR